LKEQRMRRSSPYRGARGNIREEVGGGEKGKGEGLGGSLWLRTKTGGCKKCEKKGRGKTKGGRRG